MINHNGDNESITECWGYYVMGRLGKQIPYLIAEEQMETRKTELSTWSSCVRQWQSKVREISNDFNWFLLYFILVFILDGNYCLCKWWGPMSCDSCFSALCPDAFFHQLGFVLGLAVCVSSCFTHAIGVEIMPFYLNANPLVKFLWF